MSATPRERTATAELPRGAGAFFNRELSTVDWNARVLELAHDESIPPLERLRFLAIFSSNTDEFFMVRVAGLLDAASGDLTRTLVPGEPSVGELIEQIARRVREQVARQGRLLRDEVLPALAPHGIVLVGMGDLTAHERRRLDEAFARTIFPVLTPLAVGPGRPFPYISSLSLSLGVFVRDPENDGVRLARVKVPEVLPRFWEVGEGSARFLPLEDLIAAHLDVLFPGMVVEESSPFRVTRDADLDIDDEADDLLRAVENQLRRRRFGDVVRLEHSSTMSEEMRAQLVRYLGVDERHIYSIDGLLDMADLAQIASLDRPELRYPAWSGVTQRRLQGANGEPGDVFAAMRDGDVLVHHPYDAFTTSVERMIAQAVDDPDVLAIKHTIYRTSGDSPIVPGLIRAAEQGKQAVVLVELKARFDEESNIGWARALERAGVHVVYGFPDLKTHCKLALVVRREGNGIRRYAHIGTGNYNPKTARLYTDFGLFTARADITAEVANLFNYLTGFSRLRSDGSLLVAPVDLRDRVLEEIDRVVAAHSDEHPGRIDMKLNNLVDRAVIQALYRASQAGVKIRLLVRSVCCLRPGVPDLSETIEVRSLLGRFLEHSRALVFRDANGSRHYIGSADMMPRNLDHRVEVMTPVDDPELARELDEVLAICFADTRTSWLLHPDGAWERVAPAPDEPPRSAQDELMARAVAMAQEPVPEPEDLVAGERVVRLPRRPGADS